MKLIRMLFSALFVAILCVTVLPSMAAEPANLLPAGMGSFTVFITPALLCSAMGLGLRAFSKPPSGLEHQPAEVKNLTAKLRSATFEG